MRVTCPKCQCKGLVDTAPLLNKARVTCVRCGADYDVLLVDGAVETSLRSEDANTKTLELAAPPTAHAEVCVPVEPDEVLALPQESAPTVERVAEVREAAAVLDIVELPQAAQTAEPAATGTAHRPAAGSEADNELSNALADSGTFEMPVEYQPQFSRADLVRPAEQDKYSLGVRLMRVSPGWLLLCGMTFIGLVVVLNGLTSSAGQLDGAAREMRTGTTGNHATNQNTSATATAQTARTSNSAVTPVVKVERPRELEQTAQTVAVPVAPTPQPKPVETKPTPEVKAPTAPTPAPQMNSNGGFTLQVGSYNTPVEANERAAKLKAAGCEAQVVAVELPKRGTWYRVQTGRFGDRAEAARYGAQLRAKGAVESFLVAEVTGR